ncbi:MAG: signal recognition particle-docking protein FtsY [Nitrososphaerales archaeon]
MFENLKKAISTLTTLATQKTLSETEVEKALWDFEIALLESDVAEEVVKALTSKIKQEVIGLKLSRSTPTHEYLKQRLASIIKEEFFKAQPINLLSLIEAKKTQGEPYIILFLGINGTGKTTTIAKFAHYLKQKGYSIILACADTHRAGAIEQLTTHAEKLGLKVITQKYGADPAAVAKDAVIYAKKHKVDVVLVDTAGRMQTSRNLMDEMEKIIRVTKPDLRIFVGDALAGNDAVSQAKEFQKFTDFDAAVLTKVDADVKGGAALSIVYVTSKPILFLGTGQNYDSLKPFDPNEFIKSILNAQ